MGIETVQKERQERFKTLLHRYQNQEEAAVKLGFGGPAPISNLKTGKKKMGEKLAGRIEELAGLPRGVFVDPLSTPWPGHNDSHLNTVNEAGQTDRVVANLDGAISYENAGSFEFWSNTVDREIRLMAIPTTVLEQENCSIEDVKNVLISDNAQSPRIVKGDFVSMNVNRIKPVENDTYYVIQVNEQFTLRKTVYRTDGSLTLKCLNPEHEEENISADNIGSLNIVGRYVCFQGMSIS